MFVMSALYFGLTFGWTFDPNCPKGYVGNYKMILFPIFRSKIKLFYYFLGPGGLYNNASHIYCTGGAAATIDRWLLGEKHIYQNFTAAKMYDPYGAFHLRHNPQGVLGNLQLSRLLSIFQQLFGMSFIQRNNKFNNTDIPWLTIG